MLPWSISFFLFGVLIGYLVWQVKANIEKLEKANELKRLFTDIVVHDVSNPLTVVMMKAEMMLGKEDCDEVKGELQEIILAVEDAEDILREAREYSLVEDETRLEYKKMDLGEVVQEVVGGFAAILERRGMKVHYDKTPSLYAEANPRMKDVFSNLVANAIKYSPEGSGIDIGVEEIGGKIRISFRDQGEGVPDEYKETIFNRMERVDRKGVRGSGLGLAIVKKIVDLHNGRVWVEDNTPKGSVFIVELPKRQK
jgi:hypothetical protein